MTTKKWHVTILHEGGLDSVLVTIPKVPVTDAQHRGLARDIEIAHGLRHVLVIDLCPVVSG